jgi:tetratricopeptide (TPR) repeat protein
MIAKRAKTGVTRQGGTIAGQERAMAVPARVERFWLAGAGAVVAAVIALSITPAATARQWSSSSSSSSSATSSSSSSEGETTHQQEKIADMRKAKEDVNVGTFYMHKGDYGAAISRLKEAVQLDPENVPARLRLAESYDKQQNWSAALKTYQDYLRDFPNARDDKKIRNKIKELSRKSD